MRASGRRRVRENLAARLTRWAPAVALLKFGETREKGARQELRHRCRPPRLLLPRQCFRGRRLVALGIWAFLFAAALYSLEGKTRGGGRRKKKRRGSASLCNTRLFCSSTPRHRSSNLVEPPGKKSYKARVGRRGVAGISLQLPSLFKSITTWVWLGVDSSFLPSLNRLALC